MAGEVRVELGAAGPRLTGDWEGAQAANAFLDHLRARAFSPATVRAYAFDLVNLARFLSSRAIAVVDVAPVDVFDWVEWQNVRRETNKGTVVALKSMTAAASTVNRRVAAVRAFFEFLLMAGRVAANPVPAPRRGQGIRPQARGMLGHLGARAGPAAAGGWCASRGGCRNRWTPAMSRVSSPR